ncbi:type II toxin-antitoxin system PemK/MazF family toxin [Myceligenerans pegani]|uniref:Type II toxin-antitoxin system PemK/MazF family toxin n=1 Tax=Myceligenerans pegani TaxID=2776917 RepID=A0ABR9N397_9MICO|nr:type II toxin-antitoxin system PemK/MazF family toxin [Myceligenerans sp. TRM 65318]MBE1877751.1 type II toxin-antitoxin system PemK/MazF family toxin [Myceligenerans sp. TRM 65318]MBE3020022.1 type II toxin-antitoxin system PemK/MazF family toxin [Myceligenerans sp. TRM 65318]
MTDNRWIRLLGEIASAVVKAFLSNGDRRTRGEPSPKPRPPASRSVPGGGYPGDYTGALQPVYSPDLDGEPDPGEIVWTFVPFEEDHSQGKDRPVLLVGRDGRWLLGLQLTSKDNVQGGSRHGRGGRRYVDIGTGDWDPQRRPSEVLLSRVVRVDPSAVRREGAILDRAVFEKVVAEL